MQREQLSVRIVRRINEVPREAWDSLVRDGSPFMRWDWLDCLEDTGCVSDKTGWAPHHLVVEQEETLLGACPMYLKSHSMGEFVFDHQWASYAMQTGIQYYPKMLVGVPFTPVAGSRFLTAPGTVREGLETLAKRSDQLGQWLRRMLLHKDRRVVIVALAARLARIAWALLSSGQHFGRQRQHAPAA